MAILGGAGNVAGSNPSGTGSSLNYVGNLVYGFSGVFGEDDSPQTVLDFTTGSDLIKGVLQFNCFVGETDPSAGSRGTCTISMDSQVIAILKADGLSESTPSSEIQALVIPPYTRVTAALDSTGTTSTNKGSVIFTGEIQ